MALIHVRAPTVPLATRPGAVVHGIRYVHRYLPAVPARRNQVASPLTCAARLPTAHLQPPTLKTLGSRRLLDRPLHLAACRCLTCDMVMQMSRGEAQHGARRHGLGRVLFGHQQQCQQLQQASRPERNVRTRSKSAEADGPKPSHHTPPARLFRPLPPRYRPGRGGSNTLRALLRCSGRKET